MPRPARSSVGPRHVAAPVPSPRERQRKRLFRADLELHRRWLFARGRVSNPSDHHTDGLREWAYNRGSHVGRLGRGLDEAAARRWVVVDMKLDWESNLSRRGDAVTKRPEPKTADREPSIRVTPYLELPPHGSPLLTERQRQALIQLATRLRLPGRTIVYEED